VLWVLSLIFWYLLLMLIHYMNVIIFQFGVWFIVISNRLLIILILSLILLIYLIILFLLLIWIAQMYQIRLFSFFIPSLNLILISILILLFLAWFYCFNITRTIILLLIKQLILLLTLKIMSQQILTSIIIVLIDLLNRFFIWEVSFWFFNFSLRLY